MRNADDLLRHPDPPREPTDGDDDVANAVELHTDAGHASFDPQSRLIVRIERAVRTPPLQKTTESKDAWMC